MSHGVVVIWSGYAPCLKAYSIPPEGFTLGRDHADPSDDRISRRHANIRTGGNAIHVDDAGSRNGTFVNSRAVREGGVEPARLPSLVRAGRTLAVLVRDVRPFIGASITHRDELVVAGSLAGTLRSLESAANDEENVVLLGTRSVGRLLAKEYAQKLGDSVEAYLLMPGTDNTIAKHLEGKRVRTIIAVLGRPLTLPDLPELQQWLETDVRVVCVATDMDAFKFMPDPIKQRLASRVIAIPRLRFDELPTTMLDRVRKHKADAQVHTTFIELALLRARELDEDTMWGDFDLALSQWDGENPLRGETFGDAIDSRSTVYAVAPGIRLLGWRDRLGD